MDECSTIVIDMDYKGDTTPIDVIGFRDDPPSSSSIPPLPLPTTIVSTRKMPHLIASLKREIKAHPRFMERDPLIRMHYINSSFKCKKGKKNRLRVYANNRYLRTLWKYLYQDKAL